MELQKHKYFVDEVDEQMMISSISSTHKWHGSYKTSVIPHTLLMSVSNKLTTNDSLPLNGIDNNIKTEQTMTINGKNLT